MSSAGFARVWVAMCCLPEWCGETLANPRPPVERIERGE